MDNSMILSTVPLADLMAAMRQMVRDEMAAALAAQQQAADSRKLYTAADACREFDICRTTLHNWRKRGIIAGRKAGARVYFAAAELQAAAAKEKGQLETAPERKTPIKPDGDDARK
jgi:transposase-like protein